MPSCKGPLKFYLIYCPWAPWLLSHLLKHSALTVNITSQILFIFCSFRSLSNLLTLISKAKQWIPFEQNYVAYFFGILKCRHFNIYWKRHYNRGNTVFYIYPCMCSVSVYTYVYYFINTVECCKRTEVYKKHRSSMGRD